MNILRRMFGGKKIEQLEEQVRRERRRTNSAITAANQGKAQPGWGGMPSGEDASNKEYLYALAEVQQRAQDLDVNNPDVKGFHRTRVAQILGKGVAFKSRPHPQEIGLSTAETVKLTDKINRIRELHSKLGGFDASGNNHSEGKQQERAMLTALITGACLIHRVWRVGGDGRTFLPFSIELISASRISTPKDRLGDPLISYGVQYTDVHRSRVAGYHVRRVSQTRGNSFIPDYDWDYIPIEDCSLLSLTEMAGIDRALPLSHANVRMLRNRGEFLEAAVESARAQSHFYANTECAPGQDPFLVAQDNSDYTVDSGSGAVLGFSKLGGVSMLYTQSGEKVNWNSAKLPEPELEGFMGVTDERLARGFCSSLSRFTRKVNSSWAGGRLEDQQDDPIIDQYRDTLKSAWQRVNEWFLECLWLTDAVELPGYSVSTRAYWSEFHAEFPGKLSINPADTMLARATGYLLRTLTPQQACEEDGKDLRKNLRQWAEALQLAQEIETEFKLRPGSLEYLISGTTTPASGTDQSGDEEKQAAAAGGSEGGEGQTSKTQRARNLMFLNRLRDLVEAA